MNNKTITNEKINKNNKFLSTTVNNCQCPNLSLNDTQVDKKKTI